MGGEYPLVSVVIVNLNGEKWLRKCIPSVLNSDYRYMEVIVVDNGSSDGSIDFIKNHSQVKLVQFEKNMGWSLANNKGMEIAKGEIIICLNNDMEVHPQWLKEIVTVMKSDPKIGIVQCNSLSMWDRKTLDSSMNYLDKFGYAYGYTPRNHPQEVFFAEGMAFGVKRKVIEDVGMLDDYYFMGYDDIDFSWRARLAGYKVYFSPSAIVYHARGGTVGRTYFEGIEKLEWGTRNHLVTLLKNYETRNLLRILPIVLSIEMGKILYLLVVKRKPKLASAAVKGILQVVKDFNLIVRKRKEVQKFRNVPDKEVMKLMHSFKLGLQYSFITSQARGKRFILNTNPLIRCD